MPALKILRCVLAAALTILPCAALAAEEKPAPIKCDKTSLCEFQLYIENDSFGHGTDRYYTNGIKFGGGINADPLIERILQSPAESVLKRISSSLGEVH